jgi:hypothetical protein
MSDAWEIRPMVGVGPISLGMTRDEVAGLQQILGEVYAYDKIELAPGRIQLKESRDLQSPIITFENDRVVEINLDWRNKSEIFYKELSVFRSHAKDFMSLLEIDNGKAWVGLGMVLFEKLSLNSSGFFQSSKSGGAGKYWDDQNDASIDRSISVCVRDHYLPFMEHYTQISFLN